jgi:hypothetical protein
MGRTTELQVRADRDLLLNAIALKGLVFLKRFREKYVGFVVTSEYQALLSPKRDCRFGSDAYMTPNSLALRLTSLKSSPARKGYGAFR